MFDLHNHTLPGVDDGAKDMDEALEMASVAFHDGIRTILLTPHNRDVAGFLKEGTFFPRVEELRMALERRGIPVQLLAATENLLEPELPANLRAGLALPVNGTKYVLVEFPGPFIPPYAEEILFSMQLTGLVPIIVHPERCGELQRDLSKVEKLVGRGMLMQVTAASLAGELGPQARSAATAMLRRNLVHVIATDAHRPSGPRAPTISRGVAVAAKIVGEERAAALVTKVPQAILSDREVEIEPPARRRGFFPGR